MRSDVINCVICILDKIKYFEKEESYKNCIKQVIPLFKAIFAMLLTNSWLNFRVIGNIRGLYIIFWRLHIQMY